MVPLQLLPVTRIHCAAYISDLIFFTSATLCQRGYHSYGPVSVCPSVTVFVCVCHYFTSRCSIEIDGRIDLVFGTEASFDQSYSML